MGKFGTRAPRSGHSTGPAARRWFWHHQLKKPFFGRFMRPWRWPADVAQEGWQRVEIDSRSGSRLQALVARSPAATPRGVVVCAHPMGLAAKGFWLRYGHAARLLQAGFHVVAFDFNGFGESPSTNFDYPGDVLSVGRWAQREFAGLALHALTASFGAINTLSAVAESDFPFQRVVAEGCPPSLPEFWKAYPFAHAVLQVGRRFNPASERRLRPVHHLPRMPQGVEMLLIHSHGDRWTPVAFGDALERAADRPRQVRRLLLDRADHTHGLRDEPERYWPAVQAFLLGEAPALDSPSSSSPVST
jgi:pimeloyl-ACP methyl ester carboxylesterase